MSTVEEHYRELLAPVYQWMVGETALAAGMADLAGVMRAGGRAVDLGAGFGMHAIPLARAGYEVLALDSSELLLQQLQAQAQGLPIQTVRADLMTFERHLPQGAKADLILCMGDTLTHLPDPALIDVLAVDIARSLEAGGHFLATFRDYSQLPTGTARFIPVRSDDSRILTCFLEDQGETVRVHDLLHQRTETGWTLQVSHYSKLKLDAQSVMDSLQRVGLKAHVSPGARGMQRILATR